VRAYQALPSFKYKSSFKQWLFAVAIRTCYDFWRKAYRNREVPISSLTEKDQRWLEEASAVQSNQVSFEENAQQEARELLDWALSRLSAEDRMVLELVYLDGRSVKEAADLLGWTITNVKVRSFRSRRKLRTLLTGTIGA
jgi:RNA polymerase sigma-70 factor (ECF subfamily)